MTSVSIKFKKPTACLGRNGVMTMAGIHMCRQGDALFMAPITSKMQVGRAWMLVPAEMVADVAKAMLGVWGIALKAVVEIRGGVAEVTACPPGVKVEITDHDKRQGKCAA